MAFDQAGFNQELQELAAKYDMLTSKRFVHRYDCDIRRGRETCSCLGRHEYVLFSKEIEDAWRASEVLKNIGEKR